MIQELLRTCGLSANEQIVLVYLIKHPESLASIISKRTTMKRATVYVALENLVRMNVVIKKKKNNTTYFSTIHPTIIPQILKNQAEFQFQEVKKATELMTREIELLSVEQHDSVGDFEIESVESVEVIYKWLETEVLDADIYAVFDPQKLFQYDDLKKLLLKALHKNLETKPHIREIVVAGSDADLYESKIQNPFHLVRKITSSKKIPADIILVDGTVIFFHYQEKQRLGIKIRQKDLFISLKTLFETLWESEQTFV